MGLARWLTPESMGVLTGETGTYLYMSPEMIRHELYNSRTDVYSWGVLLVELISQRIPYEDQHLNPLQVCSCLHSADVAERHASDHALRPMVKSHVHAGHVCHSHCILNILFAAVKRCT